MNPRITLITPGVIDLKRSLRFYRDGLGFPTTQAGHRRNDDRRRNSISSSAPSHAGLLTLQAAKGLSHWHLWIPALRP
jgi:catechol 2,3-dioxygenase-like lactoylglutathione lyase family enzyme